MFSYTLKYWEKKDYAQELKQIPLLGSTTPACIDFTVLMDRLIHTELSAGVISVAVRFLGLIRHIVGTRLHACHFANTTLEKGRLAKSVAQHVKYESEPGPPLFESC